MIETKIRVRYAETDQMGVVYHANYLVWFEDARTAYLTEIGLTYKAIEDLGVYWVMRDAYLKYHKPVRYGEDVKVYTKLTKFNGIRFVFSYEIKVNDELRVSGYTELVNINASTFRPTNFRNIDENIYNKLSNLVEKE